MSEKYGNETTESTTEGRGLSLQGAGPETDAPEIEIDTEALVAELDGGEYGPADDSADKELAKLLARHPGAQKYYHPTGRPPLLEIMESWLTVHDAALATLDLIYHNATDGIDDSSEKAHIAFFHLRHAMKEQCRDLEDIIGLAYELHKREIGAGPSSRLAAC